MKDYFHSHFIKGHASAQTKIFCNYCYNKGHISIDCELKKSSHATWISKN